LEEVALHAALKVLMEVDINNAQIVGDPQGIVGPHNLNMIAFPS